MIKSEMTSKKANEVSYPCLKQGYDANKCAFTVLFYKSCCGMVVHSRSSDFSIGHLDSWKEEEFIPLSLAQQIILSNN